MTRRALTAPDIDHNRDRGRWSGLIRDAHAVAAGEGRMTVRELGDLANTARNQWTPVAGYPDGVACSLFATSAWAWARSPGGARGDRLKAIMLETAGMADELLAAQPEPGSPVASVRVEAASPRLPYRED